MMHSSCRGLVLSSLVVAVLASGCTWFSRSSEPGRDRGAIDSAGADVTFANDQKKARDEAAMSAKSNADASQGDVDTAAGDATAGGATATPLPSDSDSTAGAGSSTGGAGQSADSAGTVASGDMSADGQAMEPGADGGNEAMTEKVTLQGDALFKFGKADEKGMLPGGKQRLDELADKIMSMDKDAVAGIVIVGHADRLGSPTGNMKISEKRAATVMNYLARRGVDAAMMESIGKGDSDPITDCPGAGANKTLIACLSPNRRVEVIINSK